MHQILERLPGGPLSIPDHLRGGAARGHGIGRRFQGRHPGLAPARRWSGRPLPSSRSILVSMAAARSGHRKQHRCRLPALQQIVQLFLFRTGPVGEDDAKASLSKFLPGPAHGAGSRARRGRRRRAPATALQRAARRRLGRSLSIREIDAGSCNGCELEIHALSNAYYDVERFGIRFVASPRHADVLLVTGPVTKNMRDALRENLSMRPPTEMGYCPRRLRTRRWMFCRQLRGGRRGLANRSRRSSYSRLSATARYDFAGTSFPARSNGKKRHFHLRLWRQLRLFQAGKRTCRNRGRVLILNVPSGHLRMPGPACRSIFFLSFLYRLRSGKRLFENHAIHRVRSSVRGSEGLDCFMFFIFGLVTCSLRRTPRPPAELATPGLINSIPALSSAETSFIRELTFPRITPSLASMRWMVGTERCARSAVCR